MKGGISFVIIVLGIIGGLTLGLVAGWILWPVEWVDASPENLRYAWQVDWLNMAIDSYSINQSAGLAAQRYDALGPDAPAALAAIEANPTLVTSAQLEAYAIAINEAPPESGTVVPVPPSTSGFQKLLKPPALTYLLVVLCLLLVAVILLVLLVMRLMPRKKPEPTVPAVPETTIQETPAERVIEAPVAEAIIAQTVEPEEDQAGLGALASAAAVGAVVAAASGSETDQMEEQEALEQEVGQGIEPAAGDALEAGVVAAGVEWALEDEDATTPEAESEEELIEEPGEQEWQAEDTVETMPADFYGKYNRKVVEVEGIGPVYAAKLEEAGIVTTHQYLQACSTTKGRDEVAEKTGISGKMILQWANHIDLMRIQGIGPQWSDLLEMASVNTVIELSRRNPANLHQKLLDINAEKELVRQAPTLGQVEEWIDQAKDLPRILTY